MKAPSQTIIGMDERSSVSLQFCKEADVLPETEGEGSMRSHENPAGRPAVPLSPAEAKNSALETRDLLTGHSLLMLVCCAVMVIGTGFLIAATPESQAIGQTLLLAAPMLGCVGLHFVMHRRTERVCHEHAKQESNK